MSEDASVTASVEIVNAKGLHARAAAELRRTAGRFRARVTVTHEGRCADADSIMGLLMLAAARGCVVEIAARGEDAEAAVAAVVALAAGGFGEKR